MLLHIVFLKFIMSIRLLINESKIFCLYTWLLGGEMGQLDTCIQDLRNCIWVAGDVTVIRVSVDAVDITYRKRLLRDIQHYILDNHSQWRHQVCHNCSPSRG